MPRVVVVAQSGGGIARSLRSESSLLMPAGVDLEGAHAVGERVDAQAHLALRHVSGGMVSGRAERGDPYGWVLGSGVQEHGDRLVHKTNKRANTQEDTDLDLLLLHMGDQLVTMGSLHGNVVVGKALFLCTPFLLSSFFVPPFFFLHNIVFLRFIFLGRNFHLLSRALSWRLIAAIIPADK